MLGLMQHAGLMVDPQSRIGGDRISAVDGRVTARDVIEYRVFLLKPKLIKISLLNELDPFFFAVLN